MAQSNRLCKHGSQNALMMQAVDTFEGKELEWMMGMTTSPSLLPPYPFNNRTHSCHVPATTGGQWNLSCKSSFVVTGQYTLDLNSYQTCYQLQKSSV